MNALEQGTDLFSSVGLSNDASFSFVGERCQTENREKFVAFFLGNEIYCISSATVLEVVHPLPVAILPNAPAWISGIAAFRGEVVAVINIKKILGISESSANGKTKLVILRSNAKETQFAIPVDSMHELLAISPESIAVDPNDRTGGLTRLVEHESNVFRTIETDILFEKLEQSVR